jgi:hypothetical protein
MIESEFVAFEEMPSLVLASPHAVGGKVSLETRVRNLPL